METSCTLNTDKVAKKQLDVNIIQSFLQKNIISTKKQLDVNVIQSFLQKNIISTNSFTSTRKTFLLVCSVFIIYNTFRGQSHIDSSHA